MPITPKKSGYWPGSDDVEETDREPAGVRLVSARNAWLDIDRQTARAHLDKLQKARSGQETAVKRLQNRMANKNYTDKAPKELVEDTKQQLSQEETRLNAIQAELDSFEKSLN